MSSTRLQRQADPDTPTSDIASDIKEHQAPRAASSLAATLASYAVPGAGVLPMNIAQETFQEAYTFLLDAVARDDRPALIAQMQRDLDIVAQQESAHIPVARFMAGLEQQERRQRDRDLASGKLIPGAALREKLQVTPQALSAALKARRLFALSGPSGEYAYPAFFADPRHDRQTLEKVSKTLGSLPGAAKWDFFTAPRLSLGGKSPLDALAKGKVDAVMAAALAYADE